MIFYWTENDKKSLNFFQVHSKPDFSDPSPERSLTPGTLVLTPCSVTLSKIPSLERALSQASESYSLSQSLGSQSLSESELSSNEFEKRLFSSGSPESIPSLSQTSEAAESQPESSQESQVGVMVTFIGNTKILSHCG